mgnify:FL=1
MNESSRSIIESTFDASNKGTIHFGQVIEALSRIGVESYQVDYRAGRSSYVLPGDETVDLAFERPEHAIAEAFDAEAVRAAIRGAQQGKVMYPEFKHLTQIAGCIGYTVWIAGRYVVYYGRKGETHIERFPD